jgi:hypothetical protein
MGEFRPSKSGERRGGRQKGTPNKTTDLLKDAILQAAQAAGGSEGIVGYLQEQAIANPGPFMSLLGKVLPTQVTGDPDAPVAVRIEVIGGLPEMGAGAHDDNNDPDAAS